MVGCGPFQFICGIITTITSFMVETIIDSKRIIDSINAQCNGTERKLINFRGQWQWAKWKSN